MSTLAFWKDIAIGNQEASDVAGEDHGPRCFLETTTCLVTSTYSLVSLFLQFVTGVRLASTVYGFAFHEYVLLARNMGLLMIGAVVAFMLESSEFLLVMQTSGLTLSIAGIFKVRIVQAE